MYTRTRIICSVIYNEYWWWCSVVLSTCQLNDGTLVDFSAFHTLDMRTRTRKISWSIWFRGWNRLLASTQPCLRHIIIHGTLISCTIYVMWCTICTVHRVQCVLAVNGWWMDLQFFKPIHKSNTKNSTKLLIVLFPLFLMVLYCFFFIPFESNSVLLL